MRFSWKNGGAALDVDPRSLEGWSRLRVAFFPVQGLVESEVNTEEL